MKSLHVNTRFHLAGHEQGVFAHLVNRAAFIDRIEISLRGQRFDWLRAPETAEPELRITADCPIGGKNGWYGRLMHAVNDDGNAVTLKYGVRGAGKRFQNVPPIRLGLRAVGAPVTAQQIAEAIGTFMAHTDSARISLVEFSFDIRSARSVDVAKQVFARAHRFRELIDEQGRFTTYFGSPRSAVQTRVYQKTCEIVRVEFVLRNEFLQSFGVVSPEHLTRLREVPWWKYLRFMEYRKNWHRLLAKQIQRSSDWRSRIVFEWPLCSGSLELFEQMLIDEGIEPSRILRESALQRRLRAMQSKAVL